MGNNGHRTLAILTTCFNRRETTMAALQALPEAIGNSCDATVFLVDDGSRDGTAEAVRAAFPTVRVIPGSGKLYWNRGMRLAWVTALERPFDFFLWLNDDTVLRRGAISDLFRAYDASSAPRTIIVGRTCDPDTGETTYGGYRRAVGLSRLRFRHLTSDETTCDTMNGNCVLIPTSAVRDIGINSERYSHAFGDNDYGLRAKKAGYAILELKNPVSLQKKNEAYELSLKRLTIKNYKFILTHPKGLPITEWFWFCITHAGPTWPVNFVYRYIRIIFE